MAKFKAVLYDRKRADHTLAELNNLVNQLLSENVTIVKHVNEMTESTEHTDEDYQQFKQTVETAITIIAGAFESEDFETDYLQQLDANITALGYIKESELSDWLTEHGYQPAEQEEQEGEE